MPSPTKAARGLAEVRDPRRHEVEHVAVEAQLGVQRADGGDRPVVDVRDEPGGAVERGVVGLVGAVEEAGWEDVGGIRSGHPPTVGARGRPRGPVARAVTRRSGL
jgi:hypothetical protein